MSNKARLRAALRSLVPGSVVADVRKWRLKTAREDGLPEWLHRPTVQRLAFDQLGEEIDQTWFTDLSGYKEQSAAKLWLRGAGGGTTTIVVKRARGATTGYHAILGFPGPVGAPERVLYSQGPGPLGPAVPRLLTVDTPTEGETHYYFEDLLVSYRKAAGPDDIIELVGFLVDLQEPLRDWLRNAPADSVLRYDGDFPKAFMTYSRTALEDYARVSNDEACVRFLKTWDETEKIYLDRDPGEAQYGVHGDFRKDNVFVSRRGRRFKAVDWEYSGWGWIHNDFTSLMKTADPETADKALTLLASRRPEYTYEEHFDLYQRCRLERGVLDAALVARQRMATSDNPHVRADHFDLVYSAMRALDRSGT